MKRALMISLALAALLVPVFAASGSTSAVNLFDKTCGNNNPTGAGQGSTVCKSVNDQQGHNNQDPIITIVKAAIDVISFLVGIAAIIGLVVSGVRLITSGGNSESVASARSGITYSLVGIAVVVLAQTIVIFALGR